MILAVAPGGSAVLTDAVPSKTLIATAEWMTIADRASELGVRGEGAGPVVDLGRVNARVLELAREQSQDIGDRLAEAGVTTRRGRARLAGPSGSAATPARWPAAASCSTAW